MNVGFLTSQTAEVGYMDKEAEEIMKDIEQALLTTRDAERAYWKLSRGEREQPPE